MQVRELRANLAAALRRAETGERVVVTVGGRPIAQLGPIEAAARPTLDDLAAAGLVVPARRIEHPEADVVLALPVGARLDRLFEEIRG